MNFKDIHWGEKVSGAHHTRPWWDKKGHCDPSFIRHQLKWKGMVFFCHYIYGFLFRWWHQATNPWPVGPSSGINPRGAMIQASFSRIVGQFLLLIIYYSNDYIKIFWRKLTPSWSYRIMALCGGSCPSKLLIRSCHLAICDRPPRLTLCNPWFGQSAWWFQSRISM